MVGKLSLQEIATLAIIREISDSNLETGRYGPKSGVSWIIRESWQLWFLLSTGLHETSRRPCWWSRTKASFSLGNWTPFSCKFCEKKILLYWPNIHGHPVIWLQTKINILIFLECCKMLYCQFFFGISSMKVSLLCSQEVVTGLI